MEVKYDISQYITNVKMSSKKRVLVEGRDDKSHITNLLNITVSKHKIKIDTAENIRGDCQVTKKTTELKLIRFITPATLMSIKIYIFYATGSSGILILKIK